MRVASLPIINAPPPANPGTGFLFSFVLLSFISFMSLWAWDEIFIRKCVKWKFYNFTVVDLVSTPRRDLAPPIEEDEEPESESQGEAAPLRQIENTISALLRGDIPITRVPGL